MHWSITLWRFAKWAQITLGAVAKGIRSSFWSLCMRYLRIACNADHVLQYCMENQNKKIEITLKNLSTISDPWTHISVSNHTTFRPIWSGAMVPLNITPSVVVKYVWIFISLIGQVGDLLFKIASILLKETVPRDFRLLFFSWISSPKPSSISLGMFRIFFRKFAEIFATSVVDTGGKWKNLQSQKF